MLHFGSTGMYFVISEGCYKGTILQMNYRKLIMKGSFSYNSKVKFLGKKFGSHNMTIISEPVLMRCVKRGLHCACFQVYNCV